MTANQLAYQQNLERQRSNIANERLERSRQIEAKRANKAKEEQLMSELQLEREKFRDYLNQTWGRDAMGRPINYLAALNQAKLDAASLGLDTQRLALQLAQQDTDLRMLTDAEREALIADRTWQNVTQPGRNFRKQGSSIFADLLGLSQLAGGVGGTTTSTSGWEQSLDYSQFYDVY